MTLDKTRTAQEQKVANLLRMLGFKLKTDYRPEGREFDVFAVLGPLTLAVECKDYSEANIGLNSIRGFSEKLQGVGNSVGVFVANRFTSTEVSTCEQLGIAHWTTFEVEDALRKLRSEQHTRSLVPISVDVSNLLSALKTLIHPWRDYIEDWVVQHEIPDTSLFEDEHLIDVKGQGNSFAYTKTEAGEELFGQLRRLRILLSGDAIAGWEDRYEAASCVTDCCSWDDITAPDGPWDRMILVSLGIYQLSPFQLTPLGRRLQALATCVMISYDSRQDDA